MKDRSKTDIDRDFGTNLTRQGNLLDLPVDPTTAFLLQEREINGDNPETAVSDAFGGLLQGWFSGTIITLLKKILNKSFQEPSDSKTE